MQQLNPKLFETDITLNIGTTIRSVKVFLQQSLYNFHLTNRLGTVRLRPENGDLGLLRRRNHEQSRLSRSNLKPAEEPVAQNNRPAYLPPICLSGRSSFSATASGRTEIACCTLHPLNNQQLQCICLHDFLWHSFVIYSNKQARLQPIRCGGI